MHQAWLHWPAGNPDNKRDESILPSLKRYQAYGFRIEGSFEAFAMFVSCLTRSDVLQRTAVDCTQQAASRSYFTFSLSRKHRFFVTGIERSLPTLARAAKRRQKRISAASRSKESKLNFRPPVADA